MHKLAFLFGVIYSGLVCIFLLYTGNKTHSFEKFIAVLFLLALLHFLLSIRNPKYTNIFIINCMVSIFAVYAADLYLAKKHNKMKVKFSSQANSRAISDTANKIGIEFDARTKSQVITDLRNEGIDAVPFIPIGEFLRYEDKSGEYKSSIEINGRSVMPLNGIGGNRSVVVCNERGDWWVITETDMDSITDRIWEEETRYPFRWDLIHIPLSGNKAFPDLVRKSFSLTLNLGGVQWAACLPGEYQRIW